MTFTAQQLPTKKAAVVVNSNQSLLFFSFRNSLLVATPTSINAKARTLSSPTQSMSSSSPEIAPAAVEEAMENMTVNDKKSALQENLERKGKNAYYFAHAHKATGPKWDGKAEPKLLSTKSLSSDELSANNQSKKTSSFDMHKSNITSYAFCDDGPKVKLYINMENVGEICSDDDITLDYTETSFCLVIKNYNNNEIDPANATGLAPVPERCLSFGKLTANITKATFKKKKDKIILILTKEKEDVEWHTINDKGTPDHELV